MDIATPLQLAQVHSRRDIIADDWYRAVVPTACAPPDVALARLHYIWPESPAATQKALAQQLIAQLSAEQAMILYPRLTSLLLYLKLFDKSENVKEVQRIQNLRQLTVHALEQVRRVALELRPEIALQAVLTQVLPYKARHSITVMNLLYCPPIFDALVMWPPYT